MTISCAWDAPRLQASWGTGLGFFFFWCFLYSTCNPTSRETMETR